MKEYKNEKRSIVEWILQNKEEWRIICGVCDKEPEEFELKRIIKEFRENMDSISGFPEVFLVFMTQYYERIKGNF